MILNNWTNEHTSKFQNATFKAQHNLNKTGLFTDEALADLLDKHPRNKLDVCARDDHPIYEFKFRTGDVRDVDGKTLIKAAKEGSIWINVREAMNLHPDYKKVMNQMYDEIAQMTSRNIGHKAKCGLLITSPTAKTPYHFDAAEVILWHVRGHKRLFVYPLNEEFLADEAFEAALYRQTEDYLPYDKHMEKAARVIDLYDDELATWPLNSPHRVENMSFCVSVTTEYITRKSSYKNSIMYANAAGQLFISAQKLTHPVYKIHTSTRVRLS